MPHSTPYFASPLDAVKTLAAYRLRWIVPAVVISAASVGYALWRPAIWEASQALLVRDEAAGSASRPGRFNTSEDMKSAQETVLELGTSRGVVAAALRRIGPPATSRNSESWPTERDIEDAQDAIRIVAPHGAEFGRTEVFYLKVEHRDAKRAALLAKTICNQVDARTRQLRDSRAASLVTELTAAAELARADLQQSTGRLSQVEREVSSDLAELRILSQSSFGESNLRQMLIQLENEQRQAHAAQRTTEQLLDMLKAAQKDPSQLVATPNELLDAQPAIRQLKDGLVAAQLLAATLLGEMSEVHPKVKAALASEENIRRRLHAELDTAVRGLEVQLRLGADRVAAIERQLGDVAGRMDKLAALRAPYSNLLEEMSRRAQTLQQAEQDLADARASQAAALSASLITRLDDPTTGGDPVGPRKAVIILVGMIGGLAAGLGVVLLTVPLPETAAARTGKNDSQPEPATFGAGRNGHAARRGLSFKEALQRLAGDAFSRN